MLPEAVYTILVESDSCYQVGEQGQLVHNTSSGPLATGAGCCCCVEDLKLDYWRRIIPNAFRNNSDLQLILRGASEPGERRPPVYTNDKRFGHLLATYFVLQYYQADSNSECVFEWNEVQNVSTPRWPAGTSRNLVQARPGDFPNWQQHLQQRQRDIQQGKACPTSPIRIPDTDEPTIVVNPGDTGTRTLTITMIVQSSCPSGICGKQQLNVAVEQRLKVDNGVPDFLYSILTIH